MGEGRLQLEKYAHGDPHFLIWEHDPGLFSVAVGVMILFGVGSFWLWWTRRN